MGGECLGNTAKNTDWVYKNFKSWCTTRNQRSPEQRCPDNVFSSKEVACEWLCKYITETRKADSSEYTPHSLYLLCSGIQWYVCKVYPKMKFNLLILWIMSLHPSRIYVIPYLKRFIPRALELGQVQTVEWTTGMEQWIGLLV